MPNSARHADNLQKLILEELHHRIKNTLATVSAIAAQSLRTATSIEHGQHAIESRLLALGRAHDLLLQARWSSAGLAHIVRSAIEPYESKDRGAIFDFRTGHPDHLRLGDRAGDDAQRTLHQHHEIRRLVGAGRHASRSSGPSMRRPSGCI